MQLHTKKRNRLHQARLNNLVYIKYNRALRRRYDARATIDPISLENIDDSNEWMLGKVDGASDEEDALIHDGHDLTWSDVARASGIEEEAYNFRAKATKGGASSSKTIKKSLPSKSDAPHQLLQLIDEEEEEKELNINDIEEEVEYKPDEFEEDEEHGEEDLGFDDSDY